MAMKYLILGVVFIGVPFWLLQTFVLPALTNLEQIYSHVDEIAARSADARP